MTPDMSFEPLTPTAFLERSGRVFADRPAVIDGDLRLSYAEFLDRCRRLAGALRAHGVQAGDRVAVLAPNTHVLLEAHYGVPMAGAVLVALNVRLTADDLAYIIGHSGARVLIHDFELTEKANEIHDKVDGELTLIRADGPASDDLYAQLLAQAEPLNEPVTDERGLLALNYTSGTTGRPKGVMYHHRGAYLQALAMAYHTGHTADSVHLWTLPMFHCSGWCFTWAVTAAGALHLCLRALDPTRVWRHLRDDNVSHFNCAPTVLTMLAWHEEANKGRLARPVKNVIGGAPPTPALLARLADLGIEVMHLYGLTETYGPAGICEWHPDWRDLPAHEQARIKARQGVSNVIGEPMRVIDSEGRDVAADGETIGEIALRGNNIMLGYYRNEEATHRAAPDGWFRTGDLGVMHANGYIEVKDRAKDIIISGGENIASIEVENVLAAHPAVLEVAVVAKSDDKWGEIPVAFVAIKKGAEASEADLIAHARTHLAHFKAPRKVVFGELPRNATGKIQKFILRDRAREL